MAAGDFGPLARGQGSHLTVESPFASAVAPKIAGTAVEESGAERVPLRILQCLPSIGSQSGGPVRSTLANCQALHAVVPRTRTLLLSTDLGLSRQWERQVRGELSAGMELRLFRGWGRHTVAFSPGLIHWLWRHVHEFDLVVVRALFHPLSSSCALVARSRRIPYVIEPHGTLSEYTFVHRNSRAKSIYWAHVDRPLVNGAAGIRFTSATEREEAMRLSIRAPDAVIPHPVSFPAERNTDADREPDLMLFLGRLHRVKGLEVLFEAFKLLRSTQVSVRLVVAGSGPPRYERELQRRMIDLGIADAVHFIGFVDQAAKKALLSRASLFVLPSRQENFSVAVAEAMGAGVPVVVTRGVGIHNEIETYGAGLVVDRNPVDLAGAIQMILADPSRSSRMGNAARRLVEERFGLSTVGIQLAQFYRSAADPMRR